MILHRLLQYYSSTFFQMRSFEVCIPLIILDVHALQIKSFFVNVIIRHARSCIMSYLIPLYSISLGIHPTKPLFQVCKCVGLNITSCKNRLFAAPISRIWKPLMRCFFHHYHDRHHL